MHAYYQQATGYESRDSSTYRSPESDTENDLPTQEAIIVNESVGDNRENGVKFPKNHRSPPMKSITIAHPSAIQAAIAEVNHERKQARKRAKQCVVVTYFTSKVMGIMANLLLMGFNFWMLLFQREASALISRNQPLVVLQDDIQRVYLLFLSLAAVLAELDTPFARKNFRAWQKWWFKAPFYVFTAFLNGMGDFALQIRPTLQVICFILLSCSAVSSLALQLLLKQVLGRMATKKKRRNKQKSKLKGKMADLTSDGAPFGSRGTYGSVKGDGPPKRGRVVPQPRKDPTKWWQEDGLNGYDTVDMETSSVISSEGRSTANSSKWWEADVEKDGRSELDDSPPSVSGYRNALSSSSWVPRISREGPDLESSTKSSCVRDHVQSGLTLEQRPPPISSSPGATDDEAP